MLPTLVLVGRPNVGKSTLFNRLTRSRDALVADLPGLTRDRHYGRGRLGERPYLVVDTGGLEPVAKEGILHEMAKQTLQAIAEARGVPMAQVALAWVLSKPVISAPIVGPTKLSHLTDADAALDLLGEFFAGDRK